MNAERLFNWQAIGDDDGLGAVWHEAECGEITLSVWESGHQWFYSAWNNRTNEPLVNSSFFDEHPCGEYSSPDAEMRKAEQWYTEWKETE